MAKKNGIGDVLAATLGANVPAERTPETIAAEIRTFTASMLANIIEIGRRMCEAKELLDHGEFYAWLESNTGYKKSSANNFMRLYREYGDQQGSLFGAEVANLQTFGGLTYSKALALLALPSGEREEFAEMHDVQNMSTRELEDAIKRQKELEQERDEALKDAEAARAEAKTAEESRAKMESDMTLLKEQSVLDQENSEKLRERIKELETRPVDVAVQVDEDAIKKAADEARAAADAEWKGKFNDRLKSAVDEAVDVTNEEWQKKLNEVEDKFAKAKEKAKVAGEKSNGEVAKLKAEADRLRAELETARREQAKASISGDADLASFQLLFEQAQSDVNKMRGLLLKVRGREDSALGDKLAKALLALADKVKECAS